MVGSVFQMEATVGKYGSKILQYTAKNYVRTDFKSETIFSDAIDASFFAD